MAKLGFEPSHVTEGHVPMTTILGFFRRKKIFEVWIVKLIEIISNDGILETVGKWYLRAFKISVSMQIAVCLNVILETHKRRENSNFAASVLLFPPHSSR